MLSKKLKTKSDDGGAGVNGRRKSKLAETFWRTPKGMRDILPPERPWWDRIEKVLKETADFYNFQRIDTPILEHADIFYKGVGESTDIVEKEMYLVKTRGKDILALRPEHTASLVRAYLGNNLGRQSQPQRLFSYGPVFRHENPQAGRYRQFWQADFDIIGGPADPIYDAEIILIFQSLLEELKVKNTVLKINSIGCNICRPAYKRQLQNYYKNKEKKLCDDCRRHLKTNPMRLLDCKEESCREFKSQAPNFLDKLCVLCQGHFKTVLEYLEEAKISYNLDNYLVRGLDYYNRTVFEFYVEGPGEEAGALPGGGRYDYLAEMLGARTTSAVGGATGIERLITVMEAQQVKLTAPKIAKRVFLIHVGDLAKKKALSIMKELHKGGIQTAETFSKDSLKVQLRLADKEGAKIVLIFGQKEIFDGNVIIRDLENHLQETVSLDRITEEIKKRLK